MKLIEDADWVLRKAWSVKLVLLAGVFSGAELIVPLFSDAIPRAGFALLSFVVTCGAFITRFVLQDRSE